MNGFFIYLRTNGLCRVSDGYTGNQIAYVIKLRWLLPIAVGSSHFHLVQYSP